MSRTIGIDLGTTNCCVAVLDGDHPLVIPNREGERTTPSIIAFNKGEELVGRAAERQAVSQPQATIFGAKRLIGRRFKSSEVDTLRSQVPYEVVAASNGDAWVKVDADEHSPQEISARLLKRLKADAQEYLGEPVSGVIITVPAYFNDAQRQATKNAGELAGLEVKRLLNEPTAAALAYGFGKEEELRIAVFDLGGGTFDISILEIANDTFVVLATNGDTFLGGEDFDRRLVTMLLDHFQASTGLDVREDPMALQRIKTAAENAKRELSTTVTTAINLPFIGMHDDQPVHLAYDELSRSEFEGLVEDELDRLGPPCEQALADAGLSASDIDRVILVGGMTRMPAVQDRVERIFGQKPVKGVNPDEAVAVGAALQSSVLSGDLEEVLLVDVTPHSLGIKTVGDAFTRLIQRNTRIPCRKRTMVAPADRTQDFVTLEVYQGESDQVKNNKYLGRFLLGGIPRGRDHDLQIEVSFTVDADGLLKVTAMELESGREASIEVQASGGLSPHQMERIHHEMETHAFA